MKLELESEYKPYDGSTWYRIVVDGSYIDGSFNYEKIKARFDEIKKDPSLLGKNVRETLLSEEI